MCVCVWGRGGRGRGGSYNPHPRLAFRWCWFFVVDFCPIDVDATLVFRKWWGSISEETLDPRKDVNPGDGSGWGM